jgi:hypothetical protein
MEFLRALAKWQAVRTPGEMHEILSGLAGEWDVTILFHGGETPFESRATAAKHIVHGGRFLVEELTGQIYAPDRSGEMRPEPYSATRLLGFDRFKHAWVGTFVDNQNTNLLAFVGVASPDSAHRELVLFGACDEPMLDLHDATMKYVLRIEGSNRHAWEVFAMAAGGRKVFDFIYERRERGETRPAPGR